jgi:hypothetical protein
LKSFKNVGFMPADILIPHGISMEKWSVVACDQYTSEPKYWQDVENLVGDSPSTLHITFPEIYLEDTDYLSRIEKINKTMHEYMDTKIFKTLEKSFIYLERTFPSGKTRRGIVGAVDLEKYDYSPGATSLIRATERTVVERIPPRVKIRNGAPLETPHVMLLIDDMQKTVIEPFEQIKNSLELAYDFELMQNGGHIKGWHIPFDMAKSIGVALENLKENSDFLFAVGDGNHSLATAKECWEMIKKDLDPKQMESHPAKFALAEVVNIHDDSLEFEPIHRVLFDCEPKAVINEFLSCYEGATLNKGTGQQLPFICEGTKGNLFIKNPPSLLLVGTIQKFLDDYTRKYGGKIDYIHGDDVVETLSSQKGNIGFLLPAMKKSELFPSVAKDGTLPRKTFSMGEANEKRFYLECRKIR